MNRAQLDAFLAERGYKIEDQRDPHHMPRNHFRDLYLGTGKPYPELLKLRDELREALKISSVNVTMGNVEGHPAFGKHFIEIVSFWDE